MGHDVVKQRPVLEHTLSVALFSLSAFVLYYLPQHEKLIFVFFILIAFFGRRISVRTLPALGKMLGTKECISKPRNLRKFADQTWNLATHLIFSFTEIYILSSVDWWENPKSTFEPGEIPMALIYLYIFQMASYVVDAFSHCFLEERHKDFYVMYLHHVVTLALISGSYYINQPRFGMLILTVHDITDVPADLTKIANYLGLVSSSGLPLAEIFFGCVLISWAYIRLYIFPVRLIKSAFLDTGNACEGPGLTAFDAFDPPCWVLRICLLMLVPMHAFWYYLFVRIVMKLLRGVDTHQAGRDDYEGDSDSEENAAKPKRNSASSNNDKGKKKD